MFYLIKIWKSVINAKDVFVAMCTHEFHKGLVEHEAHHTIGHMSTNYMKREIQSRGHIVIVWYRIMIAHQPTIDVITIFFSQRLHSCMNVVQG